jgi:hypothetical protein
MIAPSPTLHRLGKFCYTLMNGSIQ